MTRPAATTQLGPEFDAFLFTQVGEERNGTSLSVLSVLARQDIDPWREAAGLAQMPRDAADRRLTSLLAAVPEGSLGGVQSQTVASRLTALLPSGKSSSPASVKELVVANAQLKPSTFITILIVNFIIVTVLQSVFVHSPPKGKVEEPRPSVSGSAVLK